MTKVTTGSIAYVATQARCSHRIPFFRSSLTQVRFALTSSPVFSRTDTVTDSETFYSSVLELLDDPNEQEEVNDLLAWWNR
jgi:hypothetical protein